MRINREIAKTIKELIGKYPVLALTGPRQSGKTTLLKSVFPDYTYISLENPPDFDIKFVNFTYLPVLRSDYMFFI